MKQKKILILIAIITLITTACIQEENNYPEPVFKEKRPVKVVEIQEETYPQIFKYYGIVNALGLKRYSFSQTGKIAAVFVRKSQNIKPGDSLAQLDSKDHDLAFEEAVNNLTKAASTYEYLEIQFGKIKEQWEEDKITEKEYERLKLDFELAEVNLKNSLVEYENKLNLLEETLLSADINGVVTEILFRPGEIIEKGQTVVILREEQLVVEVDISQREIALIRDSIAKIEINNKQVLGKILDIGQFPDEKSRTYRVKIALSQDEDLMLGETATVSFYCGEEKGMAVPLDSIMNKSNDYVFVVQDQLVVAKPIEIMGVINEFVFVKGLEEGDLLVVDGLNSINEGDRVHFY